MKFLKLFKSLWVYMKNDKKKIIIALILIIMSSILGLSYGYLNGASVEAITKLNIENFLIYIGLYLFIQLFANQFLKKQSRLIINKIELNLTEKISYNLFKKVGKLPAKAFEDKTSGEIINRITNDAETITDMLNQLLNMALEVFGSIIIIFYIVFNSYIVTLEIIIYIFLIVIITKSFTPKIKNYQKEIKEKTDNYITDVNQNVLGIREIRALGIRKNINNNIKQTISEVFNKRTKLLDYETKYNILIKSLNAFLEVLVFITCGLLIYYGKSNLTFFIAMTYYIYRYMWVVEAFSSFITIYQKVIVAMERISEILDNKLYEDVKYGNQSLNNISGKLTFDHVSFGYNDELLLQDFHASFEPNKKIAIVGKSGQGKTTIFNLLLRYFEPNMGSIYIDNVDLFSLTEEDLRKHISIIRQDPFLFNKTIKENFEIVRNNINLEEIRNYCKIAQIDEYIMSLKEGYDTKIGEGGVNLSGGQKQRIAIARALMKESKIILFDEATSSLDNKSQDAINKAIKEIVKNHTVIMIAHRLSTIIDADLIYVIDNGKVADYGTHAELMKTSLLYKELYTIEN